MDDELGSDLGEVRLVVDIDAYEFEGFRVEAEGDLKGLERFGVTDRQRHPQILLSGKDAAVRQCHRV